MNYAVEANNIANKRNVFGVKAAINSNETEKTEEIRWGVVRVIERQSHKKLLYRATIDLLLKFKKSVNLD